MIVDTDAPHPSWQTWKPDPMVIERGMLDLTGHRWVWVFDHERYWWAQVPVRTTWCGEQEICGPARRVHRGRPPLMDWQIDALTQILGPRTAGMVAKFYTKHPEAPRMMSLSLPRRGSREAVQKILANRELSAPW